MAPSPEAQMQTMIDNLPEKTGKSLQEWLPLIAEQQLAKHGAIVKYLKQEHGVTHGFANLLASLSLNGNPADQQGSDLIDAQYAGAKAELRPIYEALSAAVAKFGKDVEFAPKKTYVSLRRSKQFALIQPSTKTRLDVGIHLPDTASTERLESSGSFNAMVSHRVRVESVDEVDKELLNWLKQAYQRA